MSSVGIEFPGELRRCQELLAVYREMGPNGAFGAAMIEAVILEAEAAWREQDVVKILRSFQAMKGCE